MPTASVTPTTALPAVAPHQTAFRPATPTNIAQLLWNAATLEGTHLAVVTRDERIDYTELRGRSMALAHAITAKGVGAGDRVVVLLDPGLESIAAYFATLAVGAVAVVANAALRPRQIDHIIKQVSPRAIVTSADILGRQPRAIRFTGPVVDVALTPPEAVYFEPLTRSGDDLAQIIMTSGSTGQPKGVMVSHGNLWAATRTVVSYLGMTAADRVACVLPLSFVYGVSQVLCTCMAGATLVVEQSPLVHQLVETVRFEEVTILAAVPGLWMQILREPGWTSAPLKHLRIMTSAGDHLPVPAVHELRRTQPKSQLFLMYGFTEALRSTFLTPGDVDRHPGSIGRAIRGASVDILREDGTPAGVDEVGELVQRGPTVTLGYWRDPQLTQRTYRLPPFASRSSTPPERTVFSGDLVKRDEQGLLYFVGRKDQMIKTFGHRVGPDEISDVLYDSGEVAEAMIVAEPCEERGQRIVAHVALVQGGSQERLTAFCDAELPRYLQPARIEVHTELPRLPNGKFDTASV